MQKPERGREAPRKENGMRKDLKQIKEQLEQIAEQEATYLYRLAWRMQAHGCNPKHIAKVREEAHQLHMTGYPERLIDPFVTWEYAFKIK